MAAACGPELRVAVPPSPDLLTPLVAGGRYRPKAENLLVIVDVSKGAAEQALTLAGRIEGAIPRIPLVAGLRVFGLGRRGETRLLSLSRRHGGGAFQEALAAVEKAGGDGGMERAVDAAVRDLTELPGRSAVVIISDGEGQTDIPILAAAEMRMRLGGRVCIHTIHLADGDTEETDVEEGGGKSRGRRLLEKLARVGRCGFSVTSGELASAREMARFVGNVLLAENEPMPLPPPETGDPGGGAAVPAGTEPSEKRAERAADGEGAVEPPRRPPAEATGPPVPGADRNGRSGPAVGELSSAPGRPAGPWQDPEGRWVLPDIVFETGRWRIDPVHRPYLARIAEILAAEPELLLDIQGYRTPEEPDGTDRDLSERRAEAVAEHLFGLGVPHHRVVYVGYGVRSGAGPDPAGSRAVLRLLR